MENTQCSVSGLLALYALSWDGKKGAFDLLQEEQRSSGVRSRPAGSKDVWLTNACTYRGMPHDFLFLDCITFRTSDALSANMYIYTNMCASFLSRRIRGAQYGRHRFTALQRGNSFFFLCVFLSRALSNSTACSSFLGA